MDSVNFSGVPRVRVVPRSHEVAVIDQIHLFAPDARVMVDRFRAMELIAALQAWVGDSPPLEELQRQRQLEVRSACRAHASRRRADGCPDVYFIQQGSGGPIKIGCSGNPVQRMAQLQTAQSEPLSLLGHVVGDRADERAVHEQFSHLRLNGEWFSPADDLLSFIRTVVEREFL